MGVPAKTRARFRFADFTLSTSRRVLLRGGTEVPLIPRYFDLLVVLVERRNEAVRRTEILESVWSDVIVSDGALSQAVRTLRRALGDDPREPTFIRTVPRHGYRFVFADVIEEPDDTPLPAPPNGPVGATVEPADDPFDSALGILLGQDPSDDPARRHEAAETLHALGTAEALRRLDRRPGHAAARALLRDARWDLPNAGPVPILGQPDPLATTAHLVLLRIGRALRLAGRRWLAATAGGALSGVLAGIAGGLLLRFGAGGATANGILVALPLVGLVVGGAGAAGVGGGLAIAEALIRSFRGTALVVLGALGGGAVGFVAHAVALVSLESLFGHDPAPVAGGLEGIVIGGAVGLGYALATPTVEGGMATPRGRARLRAAAIAGGVCAAATALLSWSGSHLGAMSLHVTARGFPGSQVDLTPLARLLGEAEPGALTSVVIGAWEGFMFGCGVVAGLTHRPLSRSSQ